MCSFHSHDSKIFEIGEKWGTTSQQNHHHYHHTQCISLVENYDHWSGSGEGKATTTHIHTEKCDQRVFQVKKDLQREKNLHQNKSIIIKWNTPILEDGRRRRLTVKVVTYCVTTTTWTPTKFGLNRQDKTNILLL